MAEPMSAPGQRISPGIVAAALAIGLGLGCLVVLDTSPATRALLASWSGPLWLTLRIAIVSTVIAGSLGIAAGFALARGRFPGRDLLEAIGSVPIILPPTVLGYYLLTGLRPGSALGRFASTVLGRSPIFDVRGCVIVGSLAAFPYVMRAARGAIENVDRRFEHAAAAMGLPAWRVALSVTVALARDGIAVGVVLGFLRGLGEYGATLLVGGAIRGRTRTMSIAVLTETTPQQTQADLRVMLVLAAVALGLLAFLERSRA